MCEVLLCGGGAGGVPPPRPRLDRRLWASACVDESAGCKGPRALVFWVAAMTYVQCFVLCFREEGPRAVTALYFGWPAFVIVISSTAGGEGLAGRGCPPPPPLHSSLGWRVTDGAWGVPDGGGGLTDG